MARLWSGAMDNGCHGGVDDDGWWRKGALWMAMGDRKRGFERIEEEAKSLKWRTKLLKRKWISHRGKWCAKFSHTCDSPRQRAWFWKLAQKTNSHKVRTRFAFLWNSHRGPRACNFWKVVQKWNSHRVNGVRNFRTPQGGVRILLSLVLSPLFSLVFTKTSFFKPSSLPTYMLTQKNNSNHIRMKLKSKIEIKTCINTRKH